MTLKRESKATDETVAAMQAKHEQTTTSLFDIEELNLSLTNAPAAPSQNVSQHSQRMLPALHELSSSTSRGRLQGPPLGRGKAAAKAKATARSGGSGTATTTTCPQLTKCLSGCTDPVVAGPKIRKTTLKDFNMLETKMAKTLDLCREVLKLSHDDFDTEAGQGRVRLGHWQHANNGVVN